VAYFKALSGLSYGETGKSLEMLIRATGNPAEIQI
jgi:hypothetical protein